MRDEALIHRNRTRDPSRGGWSLAQIVAAVVAVLFLVILIAYCVGTGTELDTSISAKSLVLTPDVRTVAYGAPADFTVTLQFENAYDRTRDTAFRIYIYEDEPGPSNVLLDSTVVVIVPRGDTMGTADFTLDCTLIGGLLGESGSHRQSFFDYLVFAELQPIPNGVRARQSPNSEVECRKED